MRKIEGFVKSEMKKFVVSQKQKFGFNDKTKLHDHTIKQLEKVVAVLVARNSTQFSKTTLIKTTRTDFGLTYKWAFTN